MWGSQLRLEVRKGFKIVKNYKQTTTKRTETEIIHLWVSQSMMSCFLLSFVKEIALRMNIVDFENVYINSTTNTKALVRTVEILILRYHKNVSYILTKSSSL